MAIQSTISAPTSLSKDATAALEREKEVYWMSAPKFAVVGASTNPSKYGYQAFKWLLDQHKDAVPIHLTATEVQGVRCIRSITELPDPTHTAVCIVVPPAATLEIIRQAKALGIFALWFQPGAEDNSVIDFIEADAEFEKRCVYRARAMTTEDGRILPQPMGAPCIHNFVPLPL
ncbi:CoA binding domain-containing protein [Mycena rebaudengoi]|nr:CoA binding domain-containing protein [Mycena rebaudengoi]